MNNISREVKAGAAIVMACALLMCACDRTRKNETPNQSGNHLIGEGKSVDADSELMPISEIEKQWATLAAAERVPSNKKPKRSPSFDFLKEAVQERILANGHESVLTKFKVRWEANPAVSDFDHAFWSALLKLLIESGERQALIELLAFDFPRYAAPGDLMEFYLVNWGGRFIEDPALVLFEAHQNCQSPKNRESIEDAIRRAFPRIASEEQSGHKCVQACREWYISNQDRLTLNEMYAHKGMNPGYADEPLFRMKTSEE